MHTQAVLTKSRRSKKLRRYTFPKKMTKQDEQISRETQFNIIPMYITSSLYPTESHLQKMQMAKKVVEFERFLKGFIKPFVKNSSFNISSVSKIIVCISQNGAPIVQFVFK